MYTKKFDKAFKFLITNEGGFSNHINDKGGLTKFGITQMSYPNIDLEKLELNDAKEIYFQDFWDPLKLEKIENDVVASKMLDIAVNVGNHQATVILQRALRAVGHHVKEDGLIGNETISAVNIAEYREIIVALKSETAAYYRLITQANISQKVFLTGWLNRAYKTPN